MDALRGIACCFLSEEKLPATLLMYALVNLNDIKCFAALMEIMVQWVGYKRDDCSQNNL